MPRNPLFCCGNCFFSYNTSELPDYEYWECQFEAHKSVTDNTEDQLPRVHKDNCVCPNWRHQDTYLSIGCYIPEVRAQNEQP